MEHIITELVSIRGDEYYTLEKDAEVIAQHIIRPMTVWCPFNSKDSVWVPAIAWQFFERRLNMFLIAIFTFAFVMCFRTEMIYKYKTIVLDAIHAYCTKQSQLDLLTLEDVQMYDQIDGTDSLWLDFTYWGGVKALVPEDVYEKIKEFLPEGVK